MKDFKIYIVVFCSVVALVSCGGSDDPVDPVAATLVFPEKNSLCTEGTVIDNTKSDITFKWNAAVGADKYQIVTVNLENNAKSTNQSTTNQATVTLNRGARYEWYVVSLSNSSDVKETSEKWRFFNAGAGLESHPPFPATAVAPKTGNTLDNAGDVTIEWSGADPDNDIVSFELLLDTTNPPTTSIGTYTTTSAVVSTVAATTYHWRIIAKDFKNNTSQSEVFSFAIK